MLDSRFKYGAIGYKPKSPSCVAPTAVSSTRAKKAGKHCPPAKRTGETHSVRSAPARQHRCHRSEGRKQGERNYAGDTRTLWDSQVNSGLPGIILHRKAITVADLAVSRVSIPIGVVSLFHDRVIAEQTWRYFGISSSTHAMNAPASDRTQTDRKRQTTAMVTEKVACALM